MPLDANKSVHIQSVMLRSFQGRQKTVVFVVQASGGGSYTYTTVQVILRPQAVIDPQISSDVGASPGPFFDTLLVAPITTDFTGVIMIADTATATAAGVAAASKYEIIEVRTAGMVAGGTHYIAKLRRFR